MIYGKAAVVTGALTYPTGSTQVTVEASGLDQHGSRQHARERQVHQYER